MFVECGGDMLSLLWLVPTFPLLGCLVLMAFGSRLSNRLAGRTGAGSVGLSALAAIAIGVSFLSSPPPHHVYVQKLWMWLGVDGDTINVALYLDALSLVMVLVVTVVGFLIHLYSTEYMAGEEGYHRFFAYMNLFVGSMLILLLADNLLFLYLGWEGVGLCSYLLIGFWYRDPANGRAARKAFIVTRVGDAAMLIGLFVLFVHCGTLDIQGALGFAEKHWAAGSALAIAAAALLLGGAVGKSAQVPLQVWLPDAMAGPTPTSALIHAATMVTAGVYLIARTHALFILAPPVLFTVALVGAATLTIAGLSALVQTDIKRILAYSTIGQIGYMFLALGVGAWGAGIFHFMTHAFFKALLFLGAGLIIKAEHEERDIFRMHGSCRRQPLIFWTFLAGAISLADVPLVTAGFYSKDLILQEIWSSNLGGPVLWAIALAGTLITSVYMFRLFFVVFSGTGEHRPAVEPGRSAAIPCVALAVLSIVGGFVETPHSLGAVTAFSDLMETALPEATHAAATAGTESLLMNIAGAAALAGIGLAYVLYRGKRAIVQSLGERPGSALLRKYWHSGWGFDWLYERAFVRPFVWAANANKSDVVDRFFMGIARLNLECHGLLSRTQSGYVRWYVVAVGLGAVAVIGIILVL
jgi:NADH-quinone oxidoreductase subunit L